MIQSLPEQRPSTSEIFSRLVHAETDALTQYSEHDVLGTGSFSVAVYKKTYRQKPVAVKALKIDQCINDETSREEQSVMSRLNHPNVVKIFHHFDKDVHR